MGLDERSARIFPFSVSSQEPSIWYCARMWVFSAAHMDWCPLCLKWVMRREQKGALPVCGLLAAMVPARGLTQHVLPLPTHLLWLQRGRNYKWPGLPSGSVRVLLQFLKSSRLISSSFLLSLRDWDSGVLKRDGWWAGSNGKTGYIACGELKSNHKTEEKWICFSCSLCPNHSRECHWEMLLPVELPTPTLPAPLG